MFKHLLVPTGSDEFWLSAVKPAVAFAADAGARITFLYIEHPFPAMYVGEGAIMDENAPAKFHEQADRQARQVLWPAEKAAQEAGVDYTTLTLICESPYEAIIDGARRNACDLIFMASHDRAGLGQWLMSSEPEKVLSHTKIPVLLYR